MWVQDSQCSSENPLLLPLHDTQTTTSAQSTQRRAGLPEAVLYRSLTYFTLSSCKSFLQKTLTLSNFIFQVEILHRYAWLRGLGHMHVLQRGWRRKVFSQEIPQIFWRMFKSAGHSENVPRTLSCYLSIKAFPDNPKYTHILSSPVLYYSFTALCHFLQDIYHNVYCYICICSSAL